MRVRVLGPLEVVDGARPLAVGAAKQKTVLALLLARANAQVSLDDIVDEVWGERPPASATANARMYAANLRRLFATVPGGPSVARKGTGYVLAVAPDDFDLSCFRGLLRRAREAMSAGDPVTAVARFDDALALWRGPVLADVSGGQILSGWRAALDEERLSAWEARIEALLAAGAFGDAATQARELASTQPLRERAHALLIQARHEAGDTTGALAAYDAARRTLIEQLGVEPGEELRRLHRAVLFGHGAPEAGALDRAPPAGRRPGGIVPRQLPADVATFTGRATHLRRLDELLAAQHGPAATAVVISAIAGTAGVGKTALAVHWAHRMASHFPDGQLYVNMRGFDASGPPMTPAEAIRGFLDALEVPPERIPTGLDAQAGLYRSLLAGKRTLIVLDNARDADQVRPLLPGSAGCLTLVTSRNQLTSLVAAEGAYPLELGLLTADEARQFLTRRLGASRVAAEPDAVDELVGQCARLPLALAVVAARAAVRPHLRLAGLAGELRETGSGLDAMDGGDAATDVRTVLSWSYRILSGDAARLFRLLALHPGPDISMAAAASLAGVTTESARASLTELTRANMATEHRPGRYNFHDLLRAYATELGEAVDPGEERLVAIRRQLDHYVRTACAAAVLLRPQRDRIELPAPEPGSTPEHLADRPAVLRWFATERRVLLAEIRLAAHAALYDHGWRLVWAAEPFLEYRGHWQELIAMQSAGLDYVQRVGNLPREAHAHRALGRSYARLRRSEDARTQYRLALDLYGALGDDNGQGRTHSSLASLCERQGRYDEMLHHAQQAFAFARSSDSRAGQAYALGQIGTYHGLIGDHEHALANCRQALRLHQERNDNYGEASMWDSVGYALHHLGRHREAEECYRRSLGLIREVGDRPHEAVVLDHLGDAHQAAGDGAAAHATWRQAIDILMHVDHPSAERIRAKLRDLAATDHRP